MQTLEGNTFCHCTGQQQLLPPLGTFHKTNYSYSSSDSSVMQATHPSVLAGSSHGLAHQPGSETLK